MLEGSIFLKNAMMLQWDIVFFRGEIKSQPSPDEMRELKNRDEGSLFGMYLKSPRRVPVAIKQLVLGYPFFSVTASLRSHTIYNVPHDTKIDLKPLFSIVNAS